MYMASHNSSDWLYVFQKKTDWLVTSGDSLDRITTNLNDANNQYPSTVLLVGKREKDAAQRKMFPHIDHVKPRGLAQLYADASTLDSNHPLLVASLDIETAYSRFQAPRRTFGDTDHRVEWLSEHSPATTTELLVDMIISRVLLLFTDVVCFFLDDFATPEEGFHLVQRWTEANQSLHPWKPRVILVSSRRPMDKTLLSTPTFGDVRHVRLRPRHSKISDCQRYRTLKKIILQSVEIVQKRKIACKRHFSAKHHNVLFKLALQHVASRTQPEFDFILATRQLNKIGNSFTHHVETFLKLCVDSNVRKDIILRYIASAIILDSLPPGMHRKCPQFPKYWMLIPIGRFCASGNF
jgi:hypothetical protein